MKRWHRLHVGALMTRCNPVGVSGWRGTAPPNYLAPWWAIKVQVHQGGAAQGSRGDAQVFPGCGDLCYSQVALSLTWGHSSDWRLVCLCFFKAEAIRDPVFSDFSFAGGLNFASVLLFLPHPVFTAPPNMGQESACFLWSVNLGLELRTIKKFTTGSNVFKLIGQFTFSYILSRAYCFLMQPRADAYLLFTSNKAQIKTNRV